MRNPAVPAGHQAPRADPPGDRSPAPQRPVQGRRRPANQLLPAARHGRSLLSPPRRTCSTAALRPWRPRPTRSWTCRTTTTSKTSSPPGATATNAVSALQSTLWLCPGNPQTLNRYSYVSSNNRVLVTLVYVIPPAAWRGRGDLPRISAMTFAISVVIAMVPVPGATCVVGGDLPWQWRRTIDICSIVEEDRKTLNQHGNARGIRENWRTVGGIGDVVEITTPVRICPTCPRPPDGLTAFYRGCKTS